MPRRRSAQGAVKGESGIRLLIADDNPIVREALGILIGRRDDMVIVAEAASGSEALVEATRHKPDVALLDMRMPEPSGADLVAALERGAPGPRVIVFSAFAQEEDVFSALRAGAKAFLLKDTARENLFACIRAVHAGSAWSLPKRMRDWPGSSR